MATSTRIAPAWVEEQTLEVVRELLRELGSTRAAEIVTLESRFDRDLGLGSLERVELLVRCEMRFGVQLPDEIAQQGETPGEWVRAIVRGGEAAQVQTRYRIVPPAREAPPAPESARTLVEALRRHSEIEPDRVHIHLPEDERGQDITYRQLLEAATQVAVGLAAGGLGRNETVAIMLPTCADFFYAFFGVMLAGGIAVPIYPPARPDKIEEYMRRQVLILGNAEVRFLVTFQQVKGLSQLMRASLPGLVDVTTVEALRQQGGGRAPAAEPSETAFIQYTSGSTGDPKGVVLSHANILANVKGIGWGVQVRPTDVVVTWLPLYHDMGLIGSWLFSLYYATPITVLSPLAFLSRPERWLWAMHDARGTLCPAPNFSYELCARKIPDGALEGLDLSSWRVAINAGEAVLPETLARFTERFAPYGFRAESFMPCYGLAESSVALSMAPAEKQPAIDTIRREAFEREGKAEPAAPGEVNVTRFVTAGPPLPGHEVRIVDRAGRQVPDRVEGRLWFRGPSRTAGYHRNPQATAAVTTEDGWMDSGDLGYLAEGAIFITGRVKDCIIKSGRNIIPQEVEAAAAEVAGVRRGCVAAFGAAEETAGTERLVVVAETRAARAEDLRRIEAEIIRRVDEALGIPPDKVQLVSPQSIPKTSSGKIRRVETRALFLAGKLEAPKRPPWVQLVRLGLSSAGGWAGMALRQAGRRVRQSYTGAVLLGMAAVMGLAIRVTPRQARGRIFRWGSRCFLALGGHECETQGEVLGTAVLVANHAGSLDPLVVAAAVGRPLVLADTAALAALPATVAKLLAPMAAGEPGPKLRERLREALEQGCSVLVFPDGRIGEPAHRLRFRLDAFQAAVETGTPVTPVAVAGTSHLLESARHPALRKKSKIVMGAPIAPQSADRREIVRLRDRVREELGRVLQ